MSDGPVELSRLRAELEVARRQVTALRVENARLRAASVGQLSLDVAIPVEPTPVRAGDLPAVDKDSSLAEKLALFRMLFHGRSDVYATRGVSARTGKKGWSPAEADRWARREEDQREFLPLADWVVELHLRGSADQRKNVHVGVYPMLTDDTCRRQGRSSSRVRR